MVRPLLSSSNYRSLIRYQRRRQWKFHKTLCSSTSSLEPNPHYVDIREAPDGFEPTSAVVYPNFVTPDEGEALVNDIRSRTKRRRYEKGHWDAVITAYKEVELFDEQALANESQSLIHRVRDQLEAYHVRPQVREQVQWLNCHAIDLRKDGELKAHVDSVRFSGDLVAGVSLLSMAIMRLVPDNENVSGRVDLFLPPLSLYVLSGVSRYEYSHQLLPPGSIFSYANGTQEEIEKVVEREDRISVIFRDAKLEEP